MALFDLAGSAMLPWIPVSDSSAGGPSSDGSSAQTVDDPGVQFSGDYVTGNSSAQAQRDNNLGLINQIFGTFTGQNQKVLQDLQAAAAKAQYEYSERLSSTAYQRAVKDMKAAGLNPAVMFAGSQGSAASTPQVGIANVASENQLIGGINSAASMISAIAQVSKGVGSILGVVAHFL